MSTVFAVFRRDGENVESHEIDAMLSAEPEHGVDGQNSWSGGCAALAHQHLWITPEEQGEQQPLEVADGRYAISFDGRMDNREELRRELSLPLDMPATDAFLVLHAYMAWGESCVGKLLGDFAFVVWDSDERRLFVARDPLGVRPIAYYFDAHRCIVSSTVAPILAHPQVVPEINEGRIGEFVVRYDLNQEESFFSRIFFCPPAHSLTITEQSVNKRRYWLPELDRRIYYRDSREYVEQFRELFHRSVVARLRVAGEIGVTLSSGMDSTSATAVAYNELLRNGKIPLDGLKTYTLTYDDWPANDESDDVREFASHFHLNCNFLRADTKLLSNGRPMPFMTPDYLIYSMAIPQTSRLCQQIQGHGVKLILNGQYGDILFTPQRHWAVDMVRDGQWQLALNSIVPRSCRRVDLRIAGCNVRTFGRHLLQSIAIDGNRSVQQDMLADSGVARALSESTNLAERVQQNALCQYEMSSDTLSCLTSMHWNYHIHSSSLMLRGMQNLGMEWWGPYRDRRLFEFVLAIPSYLAGRPQRGNNKWILREAMRGTLPENTRVRPRHSGSRSWANAWFAGDEGRALASLLQNGLVIQHGYYDATWIERRLEEQRRKPAYDNGLWRCACLEFWLQAFSPEATKLGAD